MAAHADGSAVTGAAPAVPGEVLVVYGTGFGPTDRARLSGFAIPVEPAFRVVDTAEVSLNGAALAAEDAYAVPGKVGLDAVRFRVPDDAAAGTVPLRVTVNGQESNTVSLPVGAR